MNEKGSERNRLNEMKYTSSNTIDLHRPLNYNQHGKLDFIKDSVGNKNY